MICEISKVVLNDRIEWKELIEILNNTKTHFNIGYDRYLSQNISMFSKKINEEKMYMQFDNKENQLLTKKINKLIVKQNKMLRELIVMVNDERLLEIALIDKKFKLKNDLFLYAKFLFIQPEFNCIKELVIKINILVEKIEKTFKEVF